jgi:hypothetical protein
LSDIAAGGELNTPTAPSKPEKNARPPMTSSPITEIERLRDILRRVEPHLDAIVCYASTMGEHEPNRIARDVRDALTMRSSAPPVMGMEEMVERCARAIESGSGNPDTFAGTVSDTARRDARVVLEASGLLSTPLVTGRE